jgi:hypothetical protein
MFLRRNKKEILESFGPFANNAYTSVVKKGSLDTPFFSCGRGGGVEPHSIQFNSIQFSHAPRRRRRRRRRRSGVGVG